MLHECMCISKPNRTSRHFAHLLIINLRTFLLAITLGIQSITNGADGQLVIRSRKWRGASCGKHVTVADLYTE